MLNEDQLSNVFFFGEKLISDEKIKKIQKYIRQTGMLRTQPSVVKRLMDLTKQENVEIKDVEETIESAPAIASKILKMANSSFYGLNRKVDSLKRAVLVLGLNVIRDVAISFSVLKMFGSVGGVLSEIRKHTVASAIASKMISANYSVDVDPDICFTCGLLHSIGKMFMGMKKEYITVTQVFAEKGLHEMLKKEKEIFGFDNSEAGAVVANIWDFSDLIYYVIFHQNEIDQIMNIDLDTSDIPPKYIWTTAVVSLGVRLSYYIGAGSEPRDMISERHIKFLGFESKETFLEAFENVFRETYYREKSIFL